MLENGNKSRGELEKYKLKVVKDKWKNYKQTNSEDDYNI